MSCVARIFLSIHRDGFGTLFNGSNRYLSALVISENEEVSQRSSPEDSYE